MGLNCTGKYLSCYLIFDILLYLSGIASTGVYYLLLSVIPSVIISGGVLF